MTDNLRFLTQEEYKKDFLVKIYIRVCIRVIRKSHDALAIKSAETRRWCLQLLEPC